MCSGALALLDAGSRLFTKLDNQNCLQFHLIARCPLVGQIALMNPSTLDDLGLKSDSVPLPSQVKGVDPRGSRPIVELH